MNDLVTVEEIEEEIALHKSQLELILSGGIEIEFEPWPEGEEPVEEAWREYSDILTPSQIIWLNKYPQYDYWGILNDPRYAEIVKNALEMARQNAA